jgi:hypothetical protein
VGSGKWEVGWTKGLELAKIARRDGQRFDFATEQDRRALNVIHCVREKSAR